MKLGYGTEDDSYNLGNSKYTENNNEVSWLNEDTRLHKRAPVFIPIKLPLVKPKLKLPLIIPIPIPITTG